MAINFGILQPIDIAGKIASGQQEAQRNQLAQQQLAMGGLQQQKAELELGDFKRRQSALDQFVQDAAKNNKTGSEEDMLNSYGQYARAIGDPTHIMHHQELTMALKERQRYNQEQMGGRQQPPSAAPSPAAGPSAPIDEAMTLDYVKNAPAGVSYEDFAASQNTGLAKPVAARTPVVTAPLQAPGMTPAPQINNLPAAAAAAPVAPVNQLGMSPAQLQAEITRLGIEYPKGTAKGKIAILTKQLEDATKTHVVGDSLVDNTGRVIVTIPKTATPSEFEQLLAKTNLTENQKIAMRVARATKESTHAPAINITNKQEGAFEGGLGKGQADRIFASQVAAEDATAIIDTVKTGRDIMKSGMITGAGADFLVNLNQGLKTAGIDSGYADASANSQAFAANMAGNVGKLIKQFGAGTGLSDADREFAKDMAGGRISLDAKAINRILDINEKAARNTITRHNKNVKGIKTNISLEVEMPPAAPSAPVVTAPASAVDYLRANPTMKGAFDAKYGAGAADRALKGQ
jgi:hypothetical protein